MGLKERLLAKIVRTPSGCWMWQGCQNGTGYGQIRADGRMQYVHRVAYILLVGPIPEGLVLDHLCRNRACCNPEHLEPVTPAENCRRGNHRNSVKERCPVGHPYSEENTRVTAAGWRICRTCHRDREAARKAQTCRT